MSDTNPARVVENPGRHSLAVEFRHPLRIDARNRRGKKVRKGLGTSDPGEAQRLVDQLIQIIRDESLWSVGAQADAKRRGYDERVLQIFYSEMEPISRNARTLREQALPFPSRESGYSHHLFIGVPGAGKSALLRQLMGADPRHDAFPATSVNRTTTFPIETIFRPGDYAAVVTFFSEHEARFEIEESTSAAIVRAATETMDRTVRDFLEQPDMRFRLKYLLGDHRLDGASDEDPYADPDEDEVGSEGQSTNSEQQKNQQEIEGFVKRIWDLAREQRTIIEKDLGNLEDMEADDRSAALDLIQAEAESTDEYAALVFDILEELRERFSVVHAGRYDRNTTGWPRMWRINTSDRDQFFATLQFFAGISARQWGRLLTPLVNGIRVAGPFGPTWEAEMPRFVIFDTEGLGHRAGVSADLPDHLVRMLDEVDGIVLVHSAKTAMDFTVGKALEALVSMGQTKKTIIAFTHMDMVHGPNLPGYAKREHAFNNVRNIVENQLSKSLPSEAVRFVSQHLEQNVVYLGKINEPKPEPAYPELRRLIGYLRGKATIAPTLIAFPKYNTDHLVLSIREGAEAFRQPWQARLGLGAHPGERPYPWQSIKAMTRRYAEGFDDGYHLQPASNLLTCLSVAISRFLESPSAWDGEPTDDEKRDVIDHIKAKVGKSLAALTDRRLRQQPQPQWHTAYSFRGWGSTYERRDAVESIYAKWVPIPTSVGEPNAEEFLNDVKNIVLSAIESVRKEVEDQRAKVSESILGDGISKI